MRISDWSSDVCSSDLIARTYIRVLASARRVELADRQKDNAATIASAVDARVDAGKDAAVQTQRADLLRATAGMAAQKARRAYQASLRSAERRVGKACVSTSRSRWDPSH